MNPNELYQLALQTSFDPIPDDLDLAAEAARLAPIVGAYWRSLINCPAEEVVDLDAYALNALRESSRAVKKLLAPPLWAKDIGDIKAILAVPLPSDYADIRVIAKSGLLIQFMEGMTVTPEGRLKIVARLGAAADLQTGPVFVGSESVIKDLKARACLMLESVLTRMPLNASSTAVVSKNVERPPSAVIRKDMHKAVTAIIGRIAQSALAGHAFYRANLDTKAVDTSVAGSGLINEYNRALGLESESRHDRGKQFLTQAGEQFPVMGLLIPASARLSTAIVEGKSVQSLMQDMVAATTDLDPTQARKALACWRRTPAAAITPELLESFADISRLYTQLPPERTPQTSNGLNLLRDLNGQRSVFDHESAMTPERVNLVESMFRDWARKLPADELADRLPNHNTFLALRRDYLGWVARRVGELMRPASVATYLQRMTRLGPGEVLESFRIFEERGRAVDGELQGMVRALANDEANQWWHPLVMPGRMDEIRRPDLNRSIMELTQQTQLDAETAACGWCVGYAGYNTACSQNRSRLFSVRSHDGAHRMALLEVSYNNARSVYEAVQHQGPVRQGRQTLPEDREIVEQFVARLNAESDASHRFVYQPVHAAMLEAHNQRRMVGPRTTVRGVGHLLPNVEERSQADRISDILSPLLPVRIPSAFIWSERTALYGEIATRNLPAETPGPAEYGELDAQRLAPLIRQHGPTPVASPAPAPG